MQVITSWRDQTWKKNSCFSNIRYFTSFSAYALHSFIFLCLYWNIFVIYNVNDAVFISRTSFDGEKRSLTRSNLRTKHLLTLVEHQLLQMCAWFLTWTCKGARHISKQTNALNICVYLFFVWICIEKFPNWILNLFHIICCCCYVVCNVAVFCMNQCYENILPVTF